MTNALDDFVKDTVKKNSKENQKPKIKINEGRLYTHGYYVIKVDGFSDIVLLSPTIEEVIGKEDDDEERFWHTVNVFTSNSTSNKLMLWELGVDWNTVSDFKMFLMLLNCAEQSKLDLLFKDFIKSDFDIITKETDGTQEIALFNRKTNTFIDENTYNKIALCFRTIFNIFPKTELATDEATKQAFIDEDLFNLQSAEQGSNCGSALKPILSACCNHGGFKYKPTELNELNVYVLMDAIAQIQVYESATSVMKGMYSGFVDGKKIDPKAYNFVRSGS